MGGSLGHVFQPGCNSSSQRVSEPTKKCIRTIFEALVANPKNTSTRLQGILSQIPKVNKTVLFITLFPHGKGAL